MRPLMLILLNSVNAVDVPTVISYDLFTCIHTSGCEMSELMFYLRSFCHCTKMSSMAITNLSPLSSSHIATLPHAFESRVTGSALVLVVSDNTNSGCGTPGIKKVH